jgi:hypothetical protein
MAAAGAGPVADHLEVETGPLAGTAAEATTLATLVAEESVAEAAVATRNPGEAVSGSQGDGEGLVEVGGAAMASEDKLAREEAKGAVLYHVIFFPIYFFLISHCILSVYPVICKKN